LSKASAGGYLDVVRLLLDAGVDANETIGPQSALVSAIAKEHTAMFTLLVERGADLYADGVAEACVQRAKDNGLHSMLLLLQAHGVDTARTSSEKTQPQ
jgi:ankyrin repeat protein